MRTPLDVPLHVQITAEIHCRDLSELSHRIASRLDSSDGGTGGLRGQPI